MSPLKMAGAMSEAERKERRKVTNANWQKKNKHLRAKKKAIRKAGISDAQRHWRQPSKQLGLLSAGLAEAPPHPKVRPIVVARVLA